MYFSPESVFHSQNVLSWEGKKRKEKFTLLQKFLYKTPQLLHLIKWKMQQNLLRLSYTQTNNKM